MVADRTLQLLVLDVNETLFSLEPVAQRLAEIGLEGRLELWFARVLRDGFAAAASGSHAAFHDLAHHHLRLLLGTDDEVDGDAVEHVTGGFEEVVAHEDVAPALRRARDAGLKIVTLTNGAAEITRAFLERAGMTDLVDELFEADTVRAWKPRAEPYRHVSERTGVPASAAALVAVHPWDVHGAVRAGLQGGWVDRDGGPYPPYFERPHAQGPTLTAVVDALLGT